MQQESNREYAELKKFLAYFADHFFNVDSLPLERRPIATLEALEKKSMKTAFDGLRQAINDCIEMSFRLDREDVAKLDRQLRTLGIVTLSELRRRYSKKYAGIIERGQIRNDSEYHLIRNVLGDPSTKAVEERELLENLIANYEGT